MTGVASRARLAPLAGGASLAAGFLAAGLDEAAGAAGFLLADFANDAAGDFFADDDLGFTSTRAPPSSSMSMIVGRVK